MTVPIYALLIGVSCVDKSSSNDSPSVDDIEVSDTNESNDDTAEENTPEPSGEDLDDDGYGNSDCDDEDPDINPDATDYAGDNIDQDCDGEDEKGLCSDECEFSEDGICDDGGNDSEFDVCELGEDCSDCGPRRDNDGDGFYDHLDCNDDDPSIHPYAMDISGDNIDQDCDGEDFPGLCTNECAYAKDGACDDGGPNAEYSVCDLGTDCTDCGPRLDEDGDGFDMSEDCDDTDPSISPGLVDSTCDGIDNNCDGSIDEGWSGDPYEPNDSAPYDLGELSENGSFNNIYGYITSPSDVDTFQFYCHDGWGPEMGLDIKLEDVPSNLDLYVVLSFTDRSGNTSSSISSVNNTGLGGSETISWEETLSDDTGWYTVEVYSNSGSSCSQAYRLTIKETGYY
ncbi:MAG: putative metal-binding motif-containing protein [Myxococcota bacterium]|nr:putative metal-binding motif-containing protein [Myxococcota bacterium]